MAARRPLPPADVQLANPDTGLIARDWHDFFREFDLAVGRTRNIYDSPVFVGDPQAPTPTPPSDNDNSIATTKFVHDVVATLGPGFTATPPLNLTGSVLTIDLSAYAPLASPVFTGDPKAPTPATADNDTSIATTAYVKANLANYLPLTGGTLSGNLTVNGVAVSNGITGGSNAAAGTLGEYLEANVAATGLTNNTATEMGSITLTPGDWDVSLIAQYAPTGVLVVALTSISQVAATLDTTVGRWATVYVNANPGVAVHAVVPPLRFNVTINTTIHFIGYASFSSGTCTCAGVLRARRVR